ncbi:MAG: glutathione synthase, partial [Dongiaceae bacterium]
MLIAAQIDPVQNLNPAFDNTLLVLEAAGRRGHQIFYYTPDKLRTDHQGRVTANGHELALNLAADDFYALGKARLLDLSEADVVLLRQDPPVTMDYITTTYILEKLPPSTLVINHPKAVRDFPEKILPLHFPGLIPPTLITRDQEAMQEFHRAHGEIVIKPLYARQSQGVIRLKKNGDNLAAAAGPLLARYQTPLVCQRFLPEVQDGVKRLTLI